MNSNNVSHKTEEIKQDVDRILDQVETDLNRVEEHLTPGQILDELIMGKERKTLREQFDLMKENPTGTTFLTMGMFLLNQDKYGRTREEIVQEKVSEVKDKAVEKVQEVKDQVQEKTQEYKENVSDKKQEAQARVYDFKEKTQEKAREIPDFARENPFAVTTLGLGLGLAIGASFPLSQREEEVLRGQKTNSKLGQFKEELLRSGKESAHRLQNKFLDEVVQQIESRKHP